MHFKQFKKQLNTTFLKQKFDKMNTSLSFYIFRTGFICYKASFSKNMAGSTSLNWEKIKIRYLEMNPEEKRCLYKCGSNFKTIDNLPTWEEYARAKSPLSKTIKMNDLSSITLAKNAELRKKISIFMGDIVTLEVDAIVNAANSTLMGGGGVDGAIHAAAGSELKEECRTLNGCKTGEAKITCGYKLPAKYVIHTVGPKVVDPDLLGACYRNCLEIALKGNLRTIAFPCISTGVYGYPNDKAVHVALRQVRMFLEKHGSQIDRIIFCLFLPMDLHVYEGALKSYFPVLE